VWQLQCAVKVILGKISSGLAGRGRLCVSSVTGESEDEEWREGLPRRGAKKNAKKEKSKKLLRLLYNQI
jgi:hypothetical protein